MIFPNVLENLCVILIESHFMASGKNLKKDKSFFSDESKTENELEKEHEEKEVIEVIKSAQKGDKQAFQKIVDKYKNQVVGVAFKMVGDYEDAKDVSQMVFVKTYQNLSRFDTSKKFSTWLYRITINAAIDFLRKTKRHKHEVLDETFAEIKEGKPGADEVYQRGLIKMAINKSLQKLNFKQQSVFILRDLEGLDIKDVSQIMGMPQATVRWYLHRARAKLRDELVRNYSNILGNTY